MVKKAARTGVLELSINIDIFARTGEEQARN